MTANPNAMTTVVNARMDASLPVHLE
jgi:hypothetical protein